MVDTNGRAVVTGGAPLDFGGFGKEDRKRNRLSVTVSTLRFENLTTAL